MKKFLLDKWPLLAIFILSFLITWPLFLPGYFSHQDDLQVMRIFEMRKCFIDLQIPCRWVPDMGYGNGFPLFNYYGVLPYYIGALLSYLLGYIGAAKVLFFIPLILGGISMYFLGKELFGKVPGFTAAILYLFAPYRALDSYVRGAVAESFALAIAPLVFYFIVKIIREKKLKNFVGVCLSFTSFLISHNIMTIIFSPILILWTLYFIYTEKPKHLLFIACSFIVGVGMSAFFIFPAFFEKSLVQTESLTRFDLDYRAHFVSIQQLFFDRFWGYGLGSNSTISFQLGLPHWLLAAVSLPIALMGIIFKKKVNLSLKKIALMLLMIVILSFSLFMTHNRSAFIWERIDILKFAQFPWRFLSLAIFMASLLGGALLIFIKNNTYRFIGALLIIVIVILLNWNFFQPQFFYKITDDEKLSGIEWETQQRAGILDYLPKTALEPREVAPQVPQVTQGDIEVLNFVNKSNSWSFKAKVKNSGSLEVPVFDFPNWQVIANDQKIEHSHQNYSGRIGFDLVPGSYEIRGEFNNTQVRSISNIISLSSIFLLAIFLTYGKIKKIFS